MLGRVLRERRRRRDRGRRQGERADALGVGEGGELGRVVLAERPHAAGAPDQRRLQRADRPGLAPRRPAAEGRAGVVRAGAVEVALDVVGEVDVGAAHAAPQQPARLRVIDDHDLRSAVAQERRDRPGIRGRGVLRHAVGPPRRQRPCHPRRLGRARALRLDVALADGDLARPRDVVAPLADVAEGRDLVAGGRRGIDEGPGGRLTARPPIPRQHRGQESDAQALHLIPTCRPDESARARVGATPGGRSALRRRGDRRGLQGARDGQEVLAAVCPVVIDHSRSPVVSHSSSPGPGPLFQYVQFWPGQV